jgi:UDP-2-acetamido-3-amino-2,3-dideoxy-glucuronate N-acetyltransferase
VNNDLMAVHPSAVVETRATGSGLRAGPFTYLQEGSILGHECRLGSRVTIARDVQIGDRVIIGNGVSIPPGTRIEDDVAVGDNCTIASQHLMGAEESGTLTIHSGARIGAGCVLAGCTDIGPFSQVESGAVVDRSIPPYARVAGNPARVVGYVASAPMPEAPLQQTTQSPATSGSREDLPTGCFLVWPSTAEDMRGKLSALELSQALPFQTQRFFAVYDVPSSDVRGEHAHRECWQALTALHGAVRVMADDGTNRIEIELREPGQLLVIPPGVWASQYAFGPTTVLGVFASHPYDQHDYIRDYETFLKWKAEKEESHDSS